MTPTLFPGDCVLYEKVTYGALSPRRWADVPLLNGFTWVPSWRMRDSLRHWPCQRMGGRRAPQRGDVVLFRSVTDPNENVLLVKRVTQVLKQGVVLPVSPSDRDQVASFAARDGKKLLPQATDYVLRQNFYYVEGDNAAVSSDSRMWGYVPDSHLLGRMALVLWSWDSEASWFGKVRWARIFRWVG